jgi:hypothetical protein
LELNSIIVADQSFRDSDPKLKRYFRESAGLNSEVLISTISGYDSDDVRAPLWLENLSHLNEMEENRMLRNLGV